MKCDIYEVNSLDVLHLVNLWQRMDSPAVVPSVASQHLSVMVMSCQPAQEVTSVSKASTDVQGESSRQ